MQDPVNNQEELPQQVQQQQITVQQELQQEIKLAEEEL